jgi:deferrochelatase/peroxidase EfeB
LLLEIANPAEAKVWLSQQIPHVARADGYDDSACQLALAITCSGLEALGLEGPALDTFIPEFRQGMTASPRARVLGDGPSEAWRWGGVRSAPVHVLCAVFAPTAEDLDAWLSEQNPPRGFRVSYQVFGEIADYEPFGFRDGISQPYIEGSGRGSASVADRDRIAPGEFILGYKNEFKVLPASPSVPGELGTGPLPFVPLSRAGDLGRNGSFLVVRELEQDVEAFRKLPPEVAACTVGRWQDGRPLVQFPPPLPLAGSREADPAAGTDEAVDYNDFTYYPLDRAGLRCPLGAHIRRANPRDALTDPDLGVDEREAIRLANQHRILRRSRALARAPVKGLFFMCFNTNLERQFEFVQQTWMNSPKFAAPSGQIDPMSAGAHADGPRPFTVRTGPEREQVSLSRYVTLKGGAYFFMPGICALEYLAGLGSS